MANNQEDILVQMMEITACDEATARNYLSRCNWNVETAVRQFFDGDALRDDSDDDEVLPVETVHTPSLRPYRSPTAPGGYHSLFQFFAQLFTLPVRLPIYVLSYVYNFFFGSRLPTYESMHEYIEKMHPEFIPKKNYFYNKNLPQLRNDYIRNGWKYVVVYIHAQDEDKSFFVNCFESNIVRSISEQNGVLFGTVAGSEDAKRLKPDNGLGGTRQSCVLIYSIQANTLNRRLLLDNLRDPEAINRNIIITLLDMVTEDAEKEARRNLQNENRRLMEMQNREYEESLKRDLERIERQKEAKAEEERLQEEEQEKIRQHEARISKIRDFKQDAQTASVPTQGSCDLMIRFPNDKKIIKFNPQERLEKIFIEAISSEKCPLFIQMHLSFPKKPVACLPRWYFDILQVEELEPKQECLDRGLTFEEAGITHGSLVYVDNL